jgi:hypothetical chaperone protein
MQDNPALIWGLVASMYIGNVLLLVLNLPSVAVFAQLLRVPSYVIYPLILGMSIVGKGTTYRSMARSLEMPRSCFAGFAQWHELSVMKSSRDFRDFEDVARFAEAPELVGRFVRLVESDQGCTLYKAVSDTKEALSRDGTAEFRFAGPGFEIRRVVTRAEFESWIAPELEAIEEALDRVLAASSIAAQDVDRVFLTGGSSFVPAVRRIFERRFGADRMESGNEFVSIANGLATLGLREDLEAWTVAA